jgi:hypothetical protein
MKYFTFFIRLVLILFLTAWMISPVRAQVTNATFWAAADLSLGSGTGGDIGDAKTRNFGGGGSIIVTNYDDYPGYMSPFEGWVKFDLTTLGDSIPDGQDVLYAELIYKVSANTGNGFICYHLKDIDDWKEGNGSSGALDETGEGLTWTDAQAYDYENTDNYTLIYTDPNVGGTSYVGTFNVKKAVDYELGAEGNLLLTLRFYPTIDDPEGDKKWLGLYAREAPWGSVHPELQIAMDAPHIVFYIGPPQPTQFSDIENFGDIVEDEGDARLMITERPAPVNGTPGGVAAYSLDTYGDFDVRLKAKLNKLSGDGLDPKADFIVVFGYEGPMDYSYMRFTGEDINGFYKVDTTGGGTVTEVGDLVTDPAILDTMYHDYRLVRSGTTVMAYVDDVEYLSVTDDELGTEGMIGMGSYNDIALFDDFMEGEEGPQAVYDLHQKSFSIYPNPAQDKLYVKADQTIQELMITNLIGQEKMRLHMESTGVAEIDVSALKPGIYFMTLRSSDGQRQSEKFIIR